MKPIKQIRSFRQKKMLQMSSCLAFVIVWTLHSTLDSASRNIAINPMYGLFEEEVLTTSFAVSSSSWEFDSASSSSSNTSTTAPSHVDTVNNKFDIQHSNTTMTTQSRTWQNRTSTYNITQHIPYGEKKNNTTNNKNNNMSIIMEKQEFNDAQQTSTNNAETWKVTNTEKRISQKDKVNKKPKQEREKSLMELGVEDPLLLFTSCEKLNFTEVTSCGTRKCFVKVKNESNIGYLTTSLQLDFFFKTMSQAYKYTKYLDAKYKIKHFSLDKPRKIPILLPCIHRHLEKARGYFYQNHFNPESNLKEVFHPDYGLVIQKSKIAPTPHLIIAQASVKRNYYYSMLEPFLKNHVQNKTEFADRLEQEINHTLIMLQKEPCLLKDFQVLVDVYGNLYHIDLDRCFENTKMDKTQDEALIRINKTLKASIIQARFMDHN